MATDGATYGATASTPSAAWPTISHDMAGWPGHRWRSGTGAVTNDTLDLRHTVGSLRELGIRIDGVAAEAPAVLYQMDGIDGDEYWVGLGNFYVITRYNRSRLYALAVHQLAEEIRQQRAAALAGR